MRPNVSLGDNLAGLHAALGAVLALLHRDRQRLAAGGGAGAGVAGGSPSSDLPRGQVVDVAITESVLNMLEGCVPEWFAHGVNRPPSGSTLTGIVPSGTWQARDGKSVIIGGNGNSGEGVCALGGGAALFPFLK